MSLYGALTTATLGMMSQSYALNTIGVNIANVTTGGYKSTETRFQTVLSRDIFQQSDNGGVRPKDVQNIARQGLLSTTGNDLDLAINGDGFFILSPTLEVGDELFYGRDGTFTVKVENQVTETDTTGQTTSVSSSREGYLVDKNGYYLLGWVPEADGSFSNSGTLQALRVDPDYFAETFETTTNGQIGLNLPANNVEIADHAAAVAAAQAGNVPDGYESYSATVVDSNGVRQTVRFNFTKSDANTWDVSVTTQQTPVAQVDTVTLSGTIEANDVYTVSIGGTPYIYTTDGTETDISDVADAIVQAITNDTDALVTATNAAGVITLTAKTAGDAFTTTVSAQDADVEQVDTVTINGSVEAGDTYSVTVNGTTSTYTVTGLEADINAIRSAFRAQINADLGAVVTAADGGPNEITLTAVDGGTPFTATAAFTDNGGTVDNSIAIATTTDPSNPDDDAASVVTTANVESTSTTAAQTLNFDGNGQLDPQPPADLTFAMTFEDGGTATVAFDISRITQFAGDFIPTFYDSDGFEASNLSRLQFDQAGHVVGSFGGLNNRNLYKIPVAIFINPNGLEMKTGNVFAETIYSGESSIHAADQTGQADFVPATRELSNVDIADEFSRMIQTQAAYNANATAFRTADEMTVVARDLKA